LKKILAEIMAGAAVADAFLLARIFAFALSLPVILRFKLRRTASFAEPRRPRASAGPEAIDVIIRYVEAVCACRFVRAECLVRGLTLYRFLREAGLPLSLVFGVGEVEGRMTGHCWLLKDGQPFLEPHDPTPQFTVVTALPFLPLHAK
jgi:Transglutaminase-like superfamily